MTAANIKFFSINETSRTSVPAGSKGKFSWIFLTILSTCCSWLFPNATLAGLSSSEVVVVVNGKSLNSRTLANHYVAIRGIPARNVVVLPEVPSSETISVADFREKILSPLLAEIDRRKLGQHIQCIAYSADFPTAIDIAEDLKPLGKLPVYVTPKGSINGLTFLYSAVQAASPAYVVPSANFYSRGKIEKYLTFPTGPNAPSPIAAAQELIAAGQHAEASSALEELLASKEIPHKFPVAYTAAAEAALAGDSERAVELLEKAINLGWNYGKFLANDQRFDAVRQDDNFQLLELLLEQEQEFQPAVGFDARAFWAPNGLPIWGQSGAAQQQAASQGSRFLLSIVLGVTRGSGTSLPQAIEALERSKTADFTHPSGGFYFCVTADVRTSTRKWGFLGAVDELQNLGFHAEILTTNLPTNKDNVLGAQTGTPGFDWQPSGSKFLPGAIADNLTSFGGVMTAGSPQTKLTEFIKAGAAGSSGTVTEPYALQFKFPKPQMYVDYALGASLIEAFYLNVEGPYQLLIVGDPLCRPFASPPQPKLPDDGILYLSSDKKTLTISVETSGANFQDWKDNRTPASERTEPLEPKLSTFFMDGVLVGQQAPRKKTEVNIQGSPRGYHEFAVLLTAGDPLAQKNEGTQRLWIGEKDLVTLTLANAKADSQENSVSLQAAEFVTFKVLADDAQKITLRHDLEDLGTVASSSGEFKIPVSELGMGPARLFAVAEFEDSEEVSSLPFVLNVVP